MSERPLEIEIARLDHLVLTVRDIEATCAFYSRVLGMKSVTFGNGRRALHFGQQKINLHPIDNDIALKAARPLPGSADLCFITPLPLERVIAHVRACGVEVIDGPGARAGALGPITSIYFRDPDGNLVEVSNYPEPA
ncbi:MAG TPA: VOC family protein [Methylomirabilota bacterium]|nr:VOC family protein [Methylomirabilota bacterium]